MSQPVRQGVKIVAAPNFLPADARSAREARDERGRDSRPGHASITGAFIKLPDAPPATEGARG